MAGGSGTARADRPYSGVEGETAFVDLISLIGLEGGYEIYDETLVRSYRTYQSIRSLWAESGASKKDLAAWKWGPKYVVYSYCGCNDTTVVDCSRDELPIYWLDSMTLTDQEQTLAGWWEDWLSGGQKRR